MPPELIIPNRDILQRLRLEPDARQAAEFTKGAQVGAAVKDIVRLITLQSRCRPGQGHGRRCSSANGRMPICSSSRCRACSLCQLGDQHIERYFERHLAGFGVLVYL